MTILLSLIFAAGVVAVIVSVCAFNDPGRGDADGWEMPGRLAGYPLGRWAEEPAHLHSEPTLEEVTRCRYCGSCDHSTFLHASR